MNIFTQTFALFVMFVIGWAARTFGILDRSSTKRLSVFLMSICMPLLVVSAFEENVETGSVGLLGTVLVVAVIVHLVPTVLAFFLFRGKRPADAASLRFAAVLPSCGVAALPLLKAVFPDLGAFYAACFMLFSVFYMWSVGAFMLSFGKGKSFLSCLAELFNPCVIGALVGLILFLLRIRLPAFILVPVNFVGYMAIPLSMIVLGSMLREIPIKNAFLNADVYISAFIKLLALPLLVLLGCMIFGISRWTAILCVLLAALPATTLTPALAERYGAGRATGIACSAVNAVLSVFTLPVVMNVANLAFK